MQQHFHLISFESELIPYTHTYTMNNSNQSTYLLVVEDNFKMFDFEHVPSVEDLYEMDFLANPEPATQDTIVIQSQDTQAKGIIFEANLNQIQEPIRLQGNQGQPITIEMAKTLQELGVNEVLAENVPFR